MKLEISSDAEVRFSKYRSYIFYNAMLNGDLVNLEITQQQLEDVPELRDQNINDLIHYVRTHRAGFDRAFREACHPSRMIEVETERYRLTLTKSEIEAVVRGAGHTANYDT